MLYIWSIIQNKGGIFMKKIFSVIMTLAIIASLCSTFSITASAKSGIKLSASSITLIVGKSKTIKLKGISKSQTKKVKWSSNKKRIAVVNKKGKITAKKAGKTVITAKYKNKKYKCKVTVVKKSGNTTSNANNTTNKPSINKPDFKFLYAQYCNPEISRVAQDGSYLTFDSDPYDIGYEYRSEYDDLFDVSIKKVNNALGLSEAVFNKMDYTSASMGRQTLYFNDKGFYITWTYSTKYGLEVQYYLL